MSSAFFPAESIAARLAATSEAKLSRTAPAILPATNSGTTSESIETSSGSNIIPAVISISFLGAYALRNSMFDVLLMILSGGIAYLLLKAKIGANRWDGTVPGAYEVWESAFADTGSLILMQDNQDMSVVIGLAGTPLDAVMRNLLLQGYLPLKPEGVRVAWYAVAPERGPLLGWNCETGGLSGWGKGIWPVRLEPLP